MAVIEEKERPLRCFLCGEPRALAYWQGAKGKLAICRDCGFVTLPHLLADIAIGCSPGSGTGSEAKRSLERIESNFYRGCFLRIARDFRAEKIELSHERD